MSLIGALTKAAKAGEAAKKTAPFYSAVDEALANIARPKGTGAEFLTELSKQPGVKKAELADRKLEQAFKAKGKITKEEAQQVLKENSPPKLSERQLTEITDDMRETELRDKIETSGYDKWSEVPPRVLQRWNEEIDHNMEKFGDYKTPGGHNYREILLKLPESRPNANKYRDPAKYDADLRAYNASGKSDYQSSHWREDPNVLAHMRVQDRTGPNGEKILHVEEIQSDWHQEGRKQGYKSGINHEQQWKDYQKELLNKYGIESEDRNLAGIYSDLSTNATPEEIARFNELKDLVSADSKSVPDAPFKKNWHELAMKRLLNYAADKGYDSIAITPGSEQAKRYPRQVETEKIAQEQGMKGFYDQILPNYLNTFGKPYGAQVDVFNMPNPRKGLSITDVQKEAGITEQQWLDLPSDEKMRLIDDMDAKAKAATMPLHSFKITPEMRESIKQKGLPLYQQIGIPTAGAGAASQMPEPEEGLAGGGIINSVAKTEALAKLAKLREQMAPRAEAVQNLMKMDENRYLRDVVPNSLTNPEIEAEIQRMAARAQASQLEVKKADGGAINYNTAPDMSDGGRIIQGAPFKRGGKVNITTNRDAMFMELSNKKLKRK